MNARKDLGPQLSALSEKLGATEGKHFWRTLDELANTEAFQELMRLEFPEQADIWPDSLSRRHFLTLMGASLALAGLGGCSIKPAPLSKIVPYVHPPRDIVAGKPLFFATTMSFAGSAVGLLVESHMGRPTKIEGQPRPSRKPGRNVHLPSGLDPDVVRSRPLAKCHVPRPHADLERGPGRLARRTGGTPFKKGRRSPHPERTDYVAFACANAREICKGVSPGQMAHLRADSSRRASRGDCAWPSARMSTTTTTSLKPTWCCPSTRISSRPVPGTCAGSPTSSPGVACAQRPLKRCMPE